MTTTAQVAANHENAKKSTGPRSDEGKAKSSRNSLKHGVYATEPVAISSGGMTECSEEVDEFIASLVRGLEPEGRVEQEQAYRIAVIYLRLNRIVRLESLLFGAVTWKPNLGGPAELISKLDARTGTALSRALHDFRRMIENRPDRSGEPSVLSGRASHGHDELESRRDESPPEGEDNSGRSAELETTDTAASSRETKPNLDPEWVNSKL